MRKKIYTEKIPFSSYTPLGTWVNFETDAPGELKPANAKKLRVVDMNGKEIIYNGSNGAELTETTSELISRTLQNISSWMHVSYLECQVQAQDALTSTANTFS